MPTVESSLPLLSLNWDSARRNPFWTLSGDGAKMDLSEMVISKASWPPLASNCGSVSMGDSVRHAHVAAYQRRLHVWDLDEFREGQVCAG